MSAYMILRLLTVIVALVLVAVGVWHQSMVDVVAAVVLVWLVRQ